MQHKGSAVVTCRLSRSTARGVLVPGSEIEHMSPALASGLFTTGPPGKSPSLSFLSICNGCNSVVQGKKDSFPLVFLLYAHITITFTLLTSDVCGLPPTKKFSETPAECLTI